jgi:hypothetical protein
MLHCQLDLKSFFATFFLFFFKKKGLIFQELIIYIYILTMTLIQGLLDLVMLAL